MVIFNRKSLIVLCASLGLAACSTAKVTSGTFPEQGLTVSQLYKHSQHTIRVKKKVKRKAKTREQPAFKALANPEIPIHVFGLRCKNSI